MGSKGRNRRGQEGMMLKPECHQVSWRCYCARGRSDASGSGSLSELL